MKFFLVIYIGTQVAGLIDPSPVTRNECLLREAKLNRELRELVSLITAVAAPGRLPKDFQSIRVVCEYRDKRPVIAYEHQH